MKLLLSLFRILTWPFRMLWYLVFSILLKNFFLGLIWYVVLFLVAKFCVQILVNSYKRNETIKNELIHEISETKNEVFEGIQRILGRNQGKKVELTYIEQKKD